MPEFWETTFKNNPKMWGEQPTDNAWDVLDLVLKHDIKTMLIPGFGYGRNAKVFYEKGIEITGIEISKTAITRAQKYFKNDIQIYHGNVTDMPFDNNRYHAVYCYSLIHLLDTEERKKFLKDCFNQLSQNGLMIFVALSVNDHRYGKGKKIDDNTYSSQKGLNLFFYDKAAIYREFELYNIIHLKEIKEPKVNPTEIDWMVVCKRTK